MRVRGKIWQLCKKCKISFFGFPDKDYCPVCDLRRNMFLGENFGKDRDADKKN